MRLLLQFSLAVLLAAPLFSQTPDQHEFFEKKIRPLFVKSCQGCHNAKVKTAGLDLSNAEGFVHGGASGSLIAKDDPEKSLLLRVVSYDESLKMPPMGKLKGEDLANLRTWIASGAVWPGATAVLKSAAPHGSKRQFTEAEKKFWAFQPVVKPALPAVQDQSWSKHPIDRFILSKLEENRLQPAAPADRLTLLRRVTFDLTGLPPTEQEIAAFANDESAKAFEHVVDRLLASARYGEKWGRHWLDVARYADSTGNDEDHRYPYAWRYRDYVIDSFNRDVPYDQFIQEQIAGDLLPGDASGQPNRRGIIATGFLALGAKAIAQQDKKKMLYDVYDEQVDVTSKAVMGITVACARCHDHKFDPILTRDYYSMIGMFASTKSFKDSEAHVAKLLFTPLVPAAEVERYTKHQEQITGKSIEIEDLTDQEIAKHTSQWVPRLADYMLAARNVYADNQDIAAVAKSGNLDPLLIAKWIKYLKPNGESQVHLDPWRMASTTAQAEAVARTYQVNFDKQYAAWNIRLDKWRETFRRMSAEKNMPPPPRPKFEPAKDRFFSEVLFSGPFSVAKADRDKLFSEATRTQITLLTKDLEQLKATAVPEPDMACAVEESNPVDQKVFIRGDYNSLGEPAPRAMPLILARGGQPKIETASGRLELARWMTSAEHPLTARVMANRIWYWHFGEGLVRTPDNFGRMGEKPTHPELLDYLASSFVENKWSVKAMHKLILLSNAYQMSSAADEARMQADPENRLLSRFPRRRLNVEEMRDGLLAIDGSIDLTVGGTLQSGFGTDKENSNDRLSLRPEVSPRRMVYLPLRRANLPAMLNLFDFGDATTSSSKRTLTTVAPQALFMMNSDFVMERSKHLADSLLKTPADPANRVKQLYLKIVNREPDAGETDATLTYLASFQKKFEGKRTEADAWMSVARVLLASNEFIYVD